MIKQYLLSYFAAMVTFFIVDFFWLAYVATDFFKSQIGHLLKENFNMAAAVIFYLLYGIGILIFAVTPALENNSWKQALGYGALFGFFCYGAYDLTNLATLKDWPLKMAVVDMTWGTFLTAITALSSYFITQKFNF